jgi:hypothetical protein
MTYCRPTLGGAVDVVTATAQGWIRLDEAGIRQLVICKDCMFFLLDVIILEVYSMRSLGIDVLHKRRK